MAADLVRFNQTASAYDLPPPSYDAELTLVGRGTPCGELLRRYWHPVAKSTTVKDVPVRVRILAEDLILFRKPSGEVGLFYPRCAHRGADLFYGKVTELGLRCCYHGWTFEPDGSCTDIPTEPENGARMKKSIRQPWYPVEERYGFVFAFLGPLDKKPALPRYDVLENLPEGWEIIADDTTIPAAGAGYMPCNWLQHHENGMDPAHVPILHEHQFPPIMASARNTVHFYHEPDRVWGNGITEFSGMVMDFKAEMIFPTVRVIPDPLLAFPRPDGKSDSVGWTVPLDDTDTVVFTAVTRPIGAAPANNDNVYDGKTWAELSPEEHQRMPGDFEAQVGQGVISFHSEEHLGTADKGIGYYRRMLRDAIRKVQAGEDPPLAFGASEIFVTTKAGFKIFPAAGADGEPEAAAVVAVQPAMSAAIGPSGKWDLVVKSPMGEQKLRLDIIADDGKVSGSIGPEDGEKLPVREGELRGQVLAWKSDIKKPMALTVKFNLTLAGDTLTGTAKAGMFPATSVTGTRAP